MRYYVRRLQVLRLLFLLMPTTALAQEEYRFDSGLAIPQVHRYGREAIVTDQLAYELFSDRGYTPRAGAKLPGRDLETDTSWEPIAVDSTGKFRGRSLGNGYIYLTYTASRSAPALLNVTGNMMLYFNGDPRGGDIYSDGWMYIPVTVKKGLNTILIRCGNFSRWQGVAARLIFSDKPVVLKTEDATLPHVIIGDKRTELFGAIVVINNSPKSLSDLVLSTTVNGRTLESPVATTLSGTLRKVRFDIDATSVSATGEHSCRIQLKQKGKVLDEKVLTLMAVNPTDHHSYTFESDIDGSVQYYSVAPHTGTEEKPALFLSVHGAGVEAIGQARAYAPKDWGVLVAPTNRRPRGFNWEDWGRLDALEVFALAKKRFNPDRERIYLTGHSMGGHGTWFLGATYPDKWAAIAPCAGYPTLSAYGSADGKIPDSASTDSEKVLLRASHGSNVIALASNYKNHGVYIFHGDADRVVPVAFARQMRALLSGFHPDFSYYEYPGGSHWFGNESVDWPPLFNFFRWHTLKPDTAVDVINFTTANPGVSADFRWASIVQQQEPLEYSKIDLVRDRKAGTLSGTTTNVAQLRIALNDFTSSDTVEISIDSAVIRHPAGKGDVYLSRTDGWSLTENDPKEKNPARYGTFKDAFNHRMVFVYATGGNADEDRWALNKARFDAEVWYYRGNGAVEIMRDIDFNPADYSDRGIILYGNASTNRAWNTLLKNCPIQVTRDRVTLGTRSFEGNDLAAYFVWPREDSDIASVGVVTGTGLPGLYSAEPNQYFAGGSGFPDYVIFSREMLKAGSGGVKAAGFYTNGWQLQSEE